MSKLNDYLGALGEKTRKKKNVGEGKDFKKGEAVSGKSASNASFVNFGGGAKKAAESHQREQDRNYMKKKVSEKKEIMRDPAKIKAQKKTNSQALRGMLATMKFEKDSGQASSNYMDYAQDYVPLDNSMGKAADKSRARNYVKNKMMKGK